MNRYFRTAARVCVFAVSLVVSLVLVGLFGGSASAAEVTAQQWATANGATWHPAAVGAATEVAAGSSVTRVGDWVVVATWQSSGATETAAVQLLGPAPAANMTVATAAVTLDGVVHVGAVGLQYIPGLTPPTTTAPVATTTPTTTAPVATTTPTTTAPVVTTPPTTTAPVATTTPTTTELTTTTLPAPLPVATTPPTTTAPVATTTPTTTELTTTTLPAPATTVVGNGLSETQSVNSPSGGLSPLTVGGIVTATALTSGYAGRRSRRRP